MSNVPVITVRSPLPGMAAGMQRRSRERRGVAVALGTTLVVNGALFALLTLLDRTPEVPPEAPPVLHRLAVVSPPPPPIVRTVRAAATPATAPVIAAVPAPPLPALDLPAVASGAHVPVPLMPRLDVLKVPALPTVVGEAAAGDQASTVGAVPDANALLDEAPVLANGFDLERFYPRAVRLRGIEGTSTIRLEIAADGSVLECTVLAGTPPQIFDAAARALGLTLHFSPGRVHGVAVPCVISQSIAWRLPR